MTHPLSALCPSKWPGRPSPPDTPQFASRPPECGHCFLLSPPEGQLSRRPGECGAVPVALEFTWEVGYLCSGYHPGDLLAPVSTAGSMRVSSWQQPHQVSDLRLFTLVLTNNSCDCTKIISGTFNCILQRCIALFF